MCDKTVHNFPKSIHPKVNVETWIEFELASFGAAVQQYCSTEIIQFSLSHLFAQFKCQTVLFYLLKEPYQVLPLWDKVDVGAMAKKGYSTFPKSPIMETRHQIVLCYIRTLVEGVLHLCRDAIVYPPAPAACANEIG